MPAFIGATAVPHATTVSQHNANVHALRQKAIADYMEGDSFAWLSYESNHIKVDYRFVTSFKPRLECNLFEGSIHIDGLTCDPEQVTEADEAFLVKVREWMRTQPDIHSPGQKTSQQ